MKSHFHFMTILMLALSLTACGKSGSATTHGYWTPDAAYMQQLKERLTQGGIPFTVDDKGQVFWSAENSEAVLDITMDLDRRLHGGHAVRFGSDESNRYFRKLLDERNLQYFTEERTDGDWTRWYPRDKAQADELHQLVMMYEIEKTKAKMRTDCEKASLGVQPTAELSTGAQASHQPSSC